MRNFATIADVELVIQQEITGPDLMAAAEFALMTVSAAIRNYCRQQIGLVEDDVVVLDSIGNSFLLLPELPVVSVTEVVENGVTLTVTDHYWLNRYGFLNRMGRYWYFGPQAVAVTYTHGYEVIPDIVQAITARAASRLFQAGLRAKDTAGVPGVVSKALGDFSVTFGGESVTEGSMGASGARVLLLSEKDFLDAYRI